MHGHMNVKFSGINSDYIDLLNIGLYTRPALGPTQPPLQWVSGTFPGVRRSGSEVKWKVNFTPEQTTKAQTGNGGITLLFP
jgi:hypothetical protein